MMEIPETGLRLYVAYVAAFLAAVIGVGMMEIPETGLGRRGEGRSIT